MSTGKYVHPVIALQIDKLVPLPDNPFELYEGQRLEDLVESIEANGVLVPIIVRPIDDGLYEILAGHNRVEASKNLDLDTVPAIVREGLADVEAMFIAIETNIIQRSFSDFSFSERAATIAVHYYGIKDQGRRTDLIEEVEDMLRTDTDRASATSVSVMQKLGGRSRVGKAYGLSSFSVAQYLRIHKLIPEHKRRLNSGAISIRSAVSLSYLSEEEQELVDEVLTTTRNKLSMAEAEELRKARKPLTREFVYSTVEDKTTRSAAPFKLEQSFISRYFTPEQNREEIEHIIAKALDMYFGK
jgi:ParB family chromosome partitioning protein